MQIDTALKVTADSLFIQFLLKEGDVDFRQSDTKAEPCKIYRISGTKGERGLSITVENCEAHTLLTEYEEKKL